MNKNWSWRSWTYTHFGNFSKDDHKWGLRCLSGRKTNDIYKKCQSWFGGSLVMIISVALENGSKKREGIHRMIILAWWAQDRHERDSYLRLYFPYLSTFNLISDASGKRHCNSTLVTSDGRFRTKIARRHSKSERVSVRNTIKGGKKKKFSLRSYEGLAAERERGRKKMLFFKQEFERKQTEFMSLVKKT